MRKRPFQPGKTANMKATLNNVIWQLFLDGHINGTEAVQMGMTQTEFDHRWYRVTY